MQKPKTASCARAQRTMEAKKKSKRGEGYVDSGVKILIAVVIGALLLAGLYFLMNSVILPKAAEKVTSMFDTSNQAAGTYEISADVGGDSGGGGDGTSYEVVDGNKNNLHYHNDELFTGICGDYTYENGKIVSKITFNFNGGKGLMDSGSQKCESQDLANATQPTRAYTNTEPTRDGYTLLGWSTSATATTAAYTDVLSIPRTLGDNVTYYAVWEAQAQSETWVINEDISGAGEISVTLNFESDGNIYDNLFFFVRRPLTPEPPPYNYKQYLDYHTSPRPVWYLVNDGGGHWVNQAYRTITLDEPATGDFLTWLEANATRS